MSSGGVAGRRRSYNHWGHCCFVHVLGRGSRRREGRAGPRAGGGMERASRREGDTEGWTEVAFSHSHGPYSPLCTLWCSSAWASSRSFSLWVVFLLRRPFKPASLSLARALPRVLHFPVGRLAASPFTFLRVRLTFSSAAQVVSCCRRRQLDPGRAGAMCHPSRSWTLVPQICAQYRFSWFGSHGLLMMF